MAGEVTTTTVTESIYASVISDSILRELRPHQVLTPFFRKAPSGISSTVYDFLKVDDANSGVNDPSNVQSHTEANDDLTNRDWETSRVQVTATVKGLMATVTDESRTISVLDVFSEVKSAMARTMAEKWETDLAALLAGFSTVKDAGVYMDVDTFLTALSALEQADVTSSLVTVIHPKQQGQLRDDIQSKTTSYWSRTDSTSTLDMYHPNGYVGELFGVPIYQTSVVPTSDTGANRAGAMFAGGEALGLLSLWDVRSELERNASALVTEIVLSNWYGVVEIDDARGVTLKSDA